MLIRSQDKARLINLNNVEKVCIYGKINNGIIRYMNLENEEVDYFVIETPTTRLGEYCTKETAIKVLDMIQNEYQYIEECKTVGVGRISPEFVFQMPQDEEVEV